MGASAVNYVLDTAAGLTQVLMDGTNTYLYGLGRIAQTGPGGTGYYLGDVLGSVRQIADTSGVLNLSRYYEPYGTAYGVMGNASTAYGFTGEWTDGTGLVNLRARYYAPVQGRFISKDTWVGNNNTPMSYNNWIYGYANPIRFVDSSGNIPVECFLGGLCGQDGYAPSTVGYSEKIPPKNITWLTNRYSSMVHNKLAPLFDRDNKLVARVNAAQFNISHHEITCDIDSNGGCVPETMRNQNFCGQVVLSAILRVNDPNITTHWVVENLPGQSYGTGQSDIVGFVKKNFGEILYASNIDQTPERFLVGNLKGWIQYGKLVMPPVNIVNGSKWSEKGGKVGENRSHPIPHWVLITGISNEWKMSTPDSPWNWIRIYNPFDNEPEYYWWSDFKPAWFQATGGSYSTILMQPLNKLFPQWE